MTRTRLIKKHFHQTINLGLAKSIKGQNFSTTTNMPLISNQGLEHLTQQHDFKMIQQKTGSFKQHMESFKSLHNNSQCQIKIVLNMKLPPKIYVYNLNIIVTAILQNFPQQMSAQTSIIMLKELNTMFRPGSQRSSK